MTKKVSLSGVFLVVVALTYWVWSSGLLGLAFDQRSSSNVSCSASGEHCAYLVTVRDGGIDYTSQTYVFWTKHRHVPKNLPANYLVFDLETWVELTWPSESELVVEYEGGEHKQIGVLPTSIDVTFDRLDG